MIIHWNMRYIEIHYFQTNPIEILLWWQSLWKIHRIRWSWCMVSTRCSDARTGLAGKRLWTQPSTGSECGDSAHSWRFALEMCETQANQAWWNGVSPFAEKRGATFGTWGWVNTHGTMLGMNVQLGVPRYCIRVLDTQTPDRSSWCIKSSVQEQCDFTFAHETYKNLITQPQHAWRFQQLPTHFFRNGLQKWGIPKYGPLNVNDIYIYNIDND